MLLQKLDDLLLLNGAEPYREIWSELKVEIGKLHAPPQVAVDNALIQKLTEAVADLVNKQNQPVKAPTPKTWPGSASSSRASQNPPSLRSCWFSPRLR